MKWVYPLIFLIGVDCNRIVCQASCAPCTPGFFCPYNGTVSPIPCPAGSYCREGVTVSTPCTPGFYCPPSVGNQVPCPSGSYCAGFGVHTPVECPQGTYCPRNSSSPTFCPLGYQSIPDFVNRTSISSACQLCPPGTAGSDPIRLECLRCEAGYVCPRSGATTRTPMTFNEGGYVCPPGHYCPAGSFQELSCPVGSYNALTGRGSLSECLACAAGSFQDREGQVGCKPCGSSSQSSIGSRSCTCRGQDRVFQISDGSCICKPGYQFILDDQTISDQDGAQDCEPIVYDRCSGGRVRNVTGSCVDANGGCVRACRSGLGVLNRVSSICECSDVQNVDEICDESCRRRQLEVHFNPRTLRTEIRDPVAGGNITNSLASLFFDNTSVDCRAQGNI